MVAEMIFKMLVYLIFSICVADMKVIYQFEFQKMKKYEVMLELNITMLEIGIFKSIFKNILLINLWTKN